MGAKMKRTRHNPDRAWKGKSFKKGGKQITSLKREIKDLKTKISDLYWCINEMKLRLGFPCP